MLYNFILAIIGIFLPILCILEGVTFGFLGQGLNALFKWIFKH